MIKNALINQDSSVIRQYEINFEDFIKFFKIKGDFKSIEVTHGRTTRSKGGGMVTYTMSGKPWIRLTTEESTQNFMKEKTGH